MAEKHIEAKFRRKIEAAGGLCYKWVSPGNSGVPDRIVLMPGGRVYFVELKTEHGKLSPIQDRQISRLKLAGQTVFVAYGAGEAFDLAEKIVKGEI